MSVMSRLLIAATCVAASVAIVFATPPIGEGDVLDGVFGWIGATAMVFFAVLNVTEWLDERREDRADVESKTTAIQALPVADEPVTLHFPEGGER